MAACPMAACPMAACPMAACPIVAWPCGPAPAIALLRVGGLVLERAHLDRPAAGLRSLGSQFECRVQVRGLDDPEAADLLLGLGERPVGGDDLAALGSDYGRVRVRVQPAREDPGAGGLELGVERVDRLEGGLHLLVGEMRGLVVVDG